MAIIFTLLMFILSTISGQSASLTDMLSWSYNDQNLIQNDPISLRIYGKIPSYVTGKYIGVGPSSLPHVHTNFTNLYDSLGCLSSWDINGITNEATYESFIIPSAKYNETTSPTSAATSYPNDNTNLNVLHQKGSKNLLLLNQFQTIHQVNIESLQFLGPITHQDDMINSLDALAFSSSEPVEYIDSLTAEVYLINYLIVPVKNSTTSVLSLIAMNDQGVRKIFGSTPLPYLPGYLPSVVVIDDYVLITIHPIELDLDHFTSSGSSCLSCSLKSHLTSLPTHLFLFSLLSLSPHHLPEDLDIYPIQHIEIPPATDTAETETEDHRRLSPFLVTQFLSGWVDIDDTEDYPNDELMTVVLCVLTNPQQTHIFETAGDLEIMRRAPLEENLSPYCDEIRALEIAIPSRILPRHVFQSAAIPSFGLEPSSASLLSSSALRFTEEKETLHEIKLHSIVTNPFFQDSTFCFIYGLSPEMPSSPTFDGSALPGRLVKMNLCAEEKRKGEGEIDRVSALDEIPQPKVSTRLVSSFSDDRMLFGKPIFVPNLKYTEQELPVVPQPQGQGGRGQRLRGSMLQQQQGEGQRQREGPEVLKEESGSILLPTKSKLDGKSYLNVINAETMELEAVIESSFELLYSWKGVFIFKEDL
jgi:hypothetical protein